MTSGAAAERFLHPQPEHLHDPFLLHGVAAAADRLTQARDEEEKVAVVGDYDVDGVSASALLLAVLRACSIECHEVLPHRLREGYGFQPVHVERALELGCRIVVTVDCGVTAGDAIAAAEEAGLEVIVTDHHLPGSALPESALLINPRQESCSYPFADLAGVGLALKLAQAVAQRCDRQLDLRALLRIACLGTIADLVPLRGENRVIAALGLAELGRTRSPGLRALFRVSGIKPPFTASDVGFRIGPRLNAAGRLDDAAMALELLLVRDRRRAEELAESLDGWNRSRQAEEARVFEQAKEKLLELYPEDEALPPLIALWDESWHKGVLGIAAGRIARDFHRPTLLLAQEGEHAVGSGRSIGSIALHRFLEPWKERLVRFGGHSQAVGLTAPVAELEALRQEWLDRAGEEWTADQLRKVYEYEIELTADQVTDDLLRALDRLEPFGQGNQRPLLRVGPLERLGGGRIFGKQDNHLSAVARGPDGHRVNLLGWQWAPRRADLDGSFEVLAFLEQDRYRRQPVLRLVDARPL